EGAMRAGLARGARARARERIDVRLSERLLRRRLTLQRRRVAYQVLGEDVELGVGPVAAEAVGRALGCHSRPPHNTARAFSICEPRPLRKGHGPRPGASGFHDGPEADAALLDDDLEVDALACVLLLELGEHAVDGGGEALTAEAGDGLVVLAARRDEAGEELVDAGLR